MSTQLRRRGNSVEVSTVTKQGKGRKIPRSPVWVSRDNLEKLRDTIIRGALQARKDFGIKGHGEVPVV